MLLLRRGGSSHSWVFASLTSQSLGYANCLIPEELSPDPTLGNAVVNELHSPSSREYSLGNMIEKSTMGLDSDTWNTCPRAPGQARTFGRLRFPSQEIKQVYLTELQKQTFWLTISTEQKKFIFIESATTTTELRQGCCKQET